MAFPELPELPKLPKLPKADPLPDPDVELVLGPLDLERPADVEGPGWFAADADGLALHWPEYGSARVEGGRTIRLDPVAGLEPGWMRAVVLGTLFTVLLRQRGLYALHAGAVRVGDGARAFVGESGAGKSSLVAALALEGHPLLGDDVLPIERDGSGVRALPGRAEPKVDAAVAAALGVDYDALAPLPREEGSRRLATGFERAGAACGLDAVYLIEWGDELGVEPLAPQETFALFLRHAHHGELMSADWGEEQTLRRCAELAGGVRAFRFVRPRDHSGLTAGARFVAAHDPRP